MAKTKKTCNGEIRKKNVIRPQKNWKDQLGLINVLTNITFESNIIVYGYLSLPSYFETISCKWETEKRSSAFKILI